MFASEGDSRNVGRQEAPIWGARWDAPRPRPRRAAADDSAADDSAADVDDDEVDDASAGVARRLQARLDRHLLLLDRIRSDPLQSQPPGLPELMDSARRMRRDAERLLLLCGQDPGTRTGGPRRLSDVLGEVAAAAEEPSRVDVRPAPAATLTSLAATELQHVLDELVDHVIAVYPGARVDLGCRVEEPAGIVVEVRADGADRHDSDRHNSDGLGGRPAMAAAQRLASRSRSGIALRRSSAGPGSVATVHCPGAVVTLEEPDRPPVSWAADRPGFDGRGDGGIGSGHQDEFPAPHSASEPPEPESVPAVRSQVDELFGPLLDLAYEPDDDIATPIFEAIASAWFREEAPEQSDRRDPLADPLDWETPSDGEWQAAAARAAQPDPVVLTSHGLPRRRPGTQLVPPRRSQAADPDRGAAERVPDRVRDRLSTYQRGLRQGRHRADPASDVDDAGAR